MTQKDQSDTVVKKSRTGKRRLSGEVAGVGGDLLRAGLQGAGGTLLNADDIMTLIAPTKVSDGKLKVDHYALFKVMRTTCPKIKSSFATRKNGVLSKPWRVVPAEDDPDKKRAVDVASFVDAVFRQIKDFHSDLREMLDAVPTGFAVSEVMWEDKELRYPGGTRSAWVPVELRQRRQGRFAFHKDDWRLMYSPTPGQYVETDACRFLVMSHAVENEDRYGTAETSEVFWPWYLWRDSARWWAIFNEKFSQPTAVVKYRPGATDKQKAEALKAAKMIQTEYAIAIPDNLIIEFLEAERSGSINSYQTFAEWLEKLISEAVTGQSLATGQGAGGIGSYAQSKMHGEELGKFIESDCRELMSEFNSQLVRWIVDYNYGEDVPAPEWRIEYQSEDLKERLLMDKGLVELGVPLPVSYFYETYGRPAPKDGEAVAVIAQVATMGGGMGWGDREPRARQAGTEDEGDDDDGWHGEFGGKFAAGAKGDGLDREGRRRVGEREAVARAGLKGVHQANGVLIAAIRGAVDRAESLAEVDGALWRLSENPELGRGLADAIADGWMTEYLLAAAQVTRWKDGGPARRERKFAAGRWSLRALLDNVGVQATRAINWFRGLVPMTRTEMEGTYREVAVTAFTLGRDASKRTIERVQESLGKALEEGQSLSSWRKDYVKILDEEGEAPEAHREAETVYRKETAKAYGAGQKRVMEDPEIAKAFPMRMRIAIMDNRTRATHAAMHRLVLPSDDPFWMDHTPPDDYGCRCTVIELTHKYIELHGIKAHEGTLKLADGTEFDPRAVRVSPGYRFSREKSQETQKRA